MSVSLKSIALSVVVILTIGLLFFRGTDNVAPVLERNLPPGTVVQIVAFGDSLTAGYGLSLEESYPAQLESALREAGVLARVENAGVNGETTAENRARAGAVRAQNPDLVLLGIGGNDALRRLPLPATRENIKETISILQGGDNPSVVVLLQMQAPPTSGLGYKQSFDQMYEEIAEEYRVHLIPFLTAELFLQSEYKLNDGIHYNASGYKEVVDRYLKEVVLDIIKAMQGE